jgi:hypothetical protein
MKPIQSQNPSTQSTGILPPGGMIETRLRRIVPTLLAVVAFVGTSQLSAQAQTRQVWSVPVRLTVPAGLSGTITNTVFVVTTNTTTPVNLTVGALPTGVTSATFSPANPAIIGAIDSAVLTVTYNGSVPQTGVNEIEILASGDYTYRLPIPIHSAVIWSGDTNNTLWSSGGNWSGGSLPTASDVVVFPSSGANDHGTNLLTNIIVTTSREVAGMRFSHGAEDNDQNYGFEIRSGAILSVTGTSGFSFLQDTINRAGAMAVNYFGGGGLVVSNSAANIAILKEAGQNSTLNMGRLNSFTADVNRIGIGDFRLYPYYTNNGFSVRGGTATNSRPARFLPQVSLAKTNFIRATHVDANDYNDPEVRGYAVTLSNSESQGLGSGSQFSFLFGQTNVFLMDSIVFGASTAKAESDTRMRFSTDTNVIPTNVVPVAYFRGVDGVSRMSVFTVADGTGPGGSGSGTKATVNFNGGRVDALVDRLYLGRDRLESSDNDTSQAELSVAAGTFDVNTAYISMQELGNNLIPEEDQGNDPSGEVYGTLNVSTSAVFTVNGTLHLGYTTADAGDKRVAEEGNGQINVSNGGFLIASNILVGGVTKVSVNNRISITGGGELSILTEIGQPDKWLNRLSMSDSTLTLLLDGSKSTPYVYATNVVTAGNGNTIKLASVVNVTTFPTQLPLIGYASASPNFAVTLPAGFFGYIVNNTANNTIDVVILDTPPASLVWNGSPGTDWNTASANWKNGETFANGDAPTFDDTAINSNVNVPGAVFVGGAGVVVTNDSLAYSFAGAGVIGGTAPMNKWGTGSLAINTISELPLTVHEGSVTGNGAVGSTVVRSNATLNFGGSVTRLVSLGNVTLTSDATVANGVDINGGSFSSAGAITGIVEVANAQMTVTATGSINTRSASVSAIQDTNATVTLNGTWHNGVPGSPNGTYRIDVLGTLNGTGRIMAAVPDIQHATGTAPAYWSRLIIGSGGVFSPGAAPGSITIFTNQSQLDFSTGSRIEIDVNMDSASGSNPMGNTGTSSTAAKNSDVILTSRWSTRTGTLKMNRLGATPWTNGTVIKVLSKPFEHIGGGFRNRPFDGAEAQLPVMNPPSPGLGLVWDRRDLATNGVIRIAGTASFPTDLTVTRFDGTNVTFSWPSSHTGWELLTQTRSLTNGLSLARTNWTVFTGSIFTNSITITNWINSDSEAVFYRLAHPQFE